jgi:hypothetical protein
LSFPHNLGAFAAWREKFPTRIFARVAQILNYSNAIQRSQSDGLWPVIPSKCEGYKKDFSLCSK